MIEIRTIEKIEQGVLDIIRQLDEYLNVLYPLESNHLTPVDEMLSDGFIFLGAYDKNLLVGCGGVKIVDREYAEIKRMYVLPIHRGKGIAKLLLWHLEKAAYERGFYCIRLETGVSQKEAIGLYEKFGYKCIEPFGSYVADPLSLFMEKTKSI